MEEYLKICNFFSYHIDSKLEYELLSLCKHYLSKELLDVSDISSLIVYSKLFNCIDEFDYSLISNIIDNEYSSYDFYSVMDLEEISSSCNDIGNYFNLNCSIVGDIENSLNTIKNDSSYNWEDYENVSDELQEIFDFYLS